MISDVLRLFSITLKITILMSFVFLCGCAKVQLGSEAYEIAVALDAVFDKQDPAQLPQVIEVINEQRDSGELSAAEADRLDALVAMARADDWSGARVRLRQLLLDQTNW